MTRLFDSFDELTSRLRRGNESAAVEVFRRYTGRLVGLARKRLPSAVARKVGPEDVTQSVFQSFFARYKAGQFDRLVGWDEFWRLLAGITAKKCNRKIAGFRAQRRDIRREVEFGPVGEAPGAGPTAAEAAILAEAFENLVRDLSPRDRRIVTLTLEAWRPDEIGEELGCSERTVERVLARLRNRLERMRDESRDIPAGA